MAELKSLVAALLILSTIAAKPSDPTADTTTIARATTATTSPDAATAIAPATKASLTCDCKFIRDGYVIQTNASEITLFKDTDRADFQRERDAWSCDEIDQTCDIERGKDVWQRVKRVYVGDEDLPSEAVPVCTKQTFKSRKAVLFGCGIQWLKPTNYATQKELCKPYVDDECLYTSSSRFEPETIDPKNGTQQDTPEIICDCFFHIVSTNRTLTKREDLEKLGLSFLADNDYHRRTMLAWNCSNEKTCSINVNDPNSEYRKQFFNGVELHKSAVATCTKHWFRNEQRNLGVRYGCGIHWTEPPKLEEQQKQCNAKMPEMEYCVYHLRSKFSESPEPLIPPQTWKNTTGEPLNPDCADEAVDDDGRCPTTTVDPNSGSRNSVLLLIWLATSAAALFF